ncbi:MAG: DUF3826 domain-containing protein [Planctomycetales bacterium]|nr:DUF3826 domain-containing protein [Planctomycetales bacterium]
MRLVVCLVSILALCGSAHAGDGADQPAPDAEYERVIAQRAAKIVAQLGLADEQQQQRVAGLIADQYRSLSALHARRDAENHRETPAGNESELAAAQRELARLEIEKEQFALHRQFLARLAAELQPGQVDGVKDGMTYGVVGGTYARYVALLPELSDEQRRQIKAWLLEAREYAMDGGSAEEKHNWFRKYKGRINNYLSQHGLDLDAAERRWREAGASATN